MTKRESNETIIYNGNSDSAVWVCTVHLIHELPHRLMGLGWRAAATDEGRDALRTSEHVGDFWLARVEPRAQDDNQIKRNHDKTFYPVCFLIGCDVVDEEATAQ